VKFAEKQGEAAAKLPIAYTHAYVSDAMVNVEVAARRVIAFCNEGDDARVRTGILRRLLKHDPTDVIGVKQTIAQRLVEAGRYVAL
jgi:hypothetical protein